jgi:hypothetical protein
VLQLEFIDELTNTVMDIIREQFGIRCDSDEDDELYGRIHEALKGSCLSMNICPKCGKPFGVVAYGKDYYIFGCAEHREYDQEFDKQ